MEVGPGFQREAQASGSCWVVDAARKLVGFAGREVNGCGADAGQSVDAPVGETAAEGAIVGGSALLEYDRLWRAAQARHVRA